MSEENFDMNQCKAGDKLASRIGMELTYIRKMDDLEFPHVVMYPNGAYGRRTDTGRISIGTTVEAEQDIIGFLQEHIKRVEESVE
jgi:hypothetical protein